MSATNQLENDLMNLLFNNVDAKNIGDATGLVKSTAAGDFHISLHTGTLVEADTDQTSNEAAYGSYARIAVPRTSGGWTVVAGVADNAALITFPEATSGSETETDFGIGFNLSGTGYLQFFAALTASLAVSSGITPQFAIGQLDITLD